ncbi:MAG TPA: FkbM family methyltransferase [Solirubrobacteraceae bacterium]|nr:FkbM family methyltransferase [Solirubrobacteraceae bacterium]
MLAAVDGGVLQAQREAICTSAVLACSLDEHATYIDVGANRGQVLREALRIAPQARHIAFEPIPALAQELSEEFPTVDCRQMAVGARAEVTQFCHFTRLDGWSGLRRSPEVSDDRGAPQYITVNVSTLDTELEGLTPSVIKIDVEGAELAVLEGGRSVLARARPLVIFEHVAAAAALYDVAPEAVWDVLSELGYTIFSVTGEGPFTRAAFVEASNVVNWMATPVDRAG